MKFERIYLSEDNKVTLDCYLYEKSPELPFCEKRAAVVICPGGGYRICSDTEADGVAMGYSAAGFHTFVLRYSLGEAAAYPRPLTDLSRAVKLIRENAEEWGVISDNIAVCGFSAGGHLAASLGVHWSEEEIQKLSGCTGEENRPNALILGYPVISASWLERSNNAQRIIGDRDYNKTYRDFNLHLCVNEKTPPTFLCHSFSDTSVPVADSMKFAEALNEKDIPFELHIWPNGRHGLSKATEDVCADGGDADFAGWFDLSVKWLKRYFANPDEYKTVLPNRAKYLSKI